jgi:hypothetical protein
MRILSWLLFYTKPNDVLNHELGKKNVNIKNKHVCSYSKSPLDMDFLKWTIHFHELGDPSKAMV